MQPVLVEDAMAHALPNSVTEVISYATIAHTIKHHMEGNYSVVPKMTRAAKTWAGQLAGVMDFCEGLMDTFAAMPAAQLDEVRGDQTHPLHASYQDWLHMCGLRIEVTVVNSELGDACRAALTAFNAMRTLEGNGHIELKLIPLHRVLACYWGTTAFVACTNLFVGDNRAKLSETRTQASRQGMLLMLRNAAGYAADYSHTFKPKLSAHKVPYLDVQALLANNQDKIRFPASFRAIAAILAVTVPCPSVHALVALAEVVDEARADLLPTLSAFQQTDLEAILRDTSRFVEGCAGSIGTVQGPHKQAQIAKLNDIAEILEEFTAGHAVVDRRVEVQRLIVSNLRRHTGNGISPEFGPPGALASAAEWRDLHAHFLYDADVRAAWLGPDHPLPREPGPDEISRVSVQLNHNSKASVMVGEGQDHVVLVAKLYQDIVGGLRAKMVVGYYTERNKYFDKTRSWFMTETALPEADGFLPPTFNPKAVPPYLIYGDHASKLAWKVLHKDGYCWRANTRLFEGHEVYMGRIAEILQDDGPHSAYAALILARNHTEYAEVAKHVLTHNLNN